MFWLGRPPLCGKGVIDSWMLKSFVRLYELLNFDAIESLYNPEMLYSRGPNAINPAKSPKDAASDRYQRDTGSETGSETDFIPIRHLSPGFILHS